jgi:chemotaxis protein methyltransferase WspC
MSDTRFTALLERTMGLNAVTIGASGVERAVNARIKACNLAGGEAYWEMLQRSREELQELIEAVVVPETWFFRDPQAFIAMARVVQQGWPGEALRPLRLLSLPCSTGEEPYTMAMTLIDAGLPPDRFKIDAIDISGCALAKAQRGIYGGNSFRSSDLAFRERHFEKMEQGYRIGESVRAAVRFIQGNLLDAGFLGGGEVYDIVFCRNLLIYFDSDTQRRAISVLKRVLSPNGTLFVGHSESGLMHDNGLSSARIPMAFAFRRIAAIPDKPKATSAAPHPAFEPRVAVARTTPQKSRRTFALKREAPGLSLDELRRIADRGQLDEAARGCEAYIRERGASPDALLLLGLVSDASGDLAAAGGQYRRALYLEPDHLEALSHLALLLTKLGDVSGAKVLNDRILRLNTRKAG